MHPNSLADLSKLSIATYVANADVLALSRRVNSGAIFTVGGFRRVLDEDCAKAL